MAADVVLSRDNSVPATSSSTGSTSSNFGADVAVAAANGSIPAARDYDWTYSCTWPGGEVSQPSQWKAASDPARDRIPLERLGPPTIPGVKPDPILFYDDIVLYEDELGDNGCSMLGVKVRVMPSGFLVLQRFFLRVDNVVFRIFDTRMYVGFDDEKTSSGGQSSDQSSGDAATDAMATMSLQKDKPAFRVIRECSGCQAKYTDVKGRLPPYKPHDLSPLTDAGWVAQQLEKMQRDKQRGVPLVPDMPQPAVLPSSIAAGQESNRILGEVVEEDKWEGEGQWVDIVLLHSDIRL
jgi:type 2A phosphatase activator TIP41